MTKRKGEQCAIASVSVVYLAFANVSGFCQAAQATHNLSPWAKYNLAGVKAEHKRDYKSALQNYQVAITEAESSDQRFQIDMTLNNVAETLCQMGRWQEQGRVLERIVNNELGLAGPDGLLAVPAIKNLARYYGQHQENAKAENEWLRICRIQEQALGTDNSIVANSWIELAGFYNAAGKLDQYAEILTRIAAAVERAGASTRKKIVWTLIACADTCREANKPNKAEKLYREALELADSADKSSVAFAPEIAVSLVRLEGLAVRPGKVRKVSPGLTRALAICDELLKPGKYKLKPKKSAALANALFWLGEIWGKDNQSPFALPVYQKALSFKLLEGVAVGDNEVITRTMELAGINVKLRKYDQAEALYEKAVLTWLKNPGKGPPLESLLASLYQFVAKSRRLDKILSLLDRITAAAQAKYSRDSQQMVSVDYYRGIMFQSLGRDQEAEAPLKQAAAIAERLHSPSYGCYYSLGGAYMHLHKFAQAKAAILKTIPLEKAAKDVPSQGSSIFSLCSICLGLKQYDEAVTWYRELAETCKQTSIDSGTRAQFKQNTTEAAAILEANHLQKQAQELKEIARSYNGN